jgi:hypothetical protein
MAAPDSAVPLSAAGLRLTDEVGQAVLDWVAAGDLSAAAALDQHVAAVRAALAGCQPHEPRSAWLAGQAAHRAARPRPARPHHARRPGASQPAQIACPDAPFTDDAWHADTALPLFSLLHYACGFVEAAVRADWWPGENETPAGAADFESVRLAAVCRLIRQAETAAALPPDLR